MATKTERLKEIRRRLGPYTALQGTDEGYRLNDAEISRRLVEVIELLMEIVEEPKEKAPPAPADFDLRTAVQTLGTLGKKR